jgi:hypothetical protein
VRVASYVRHVALVSLLSLQQEFAADGRTPDRTWSTLALSDMALLCPGRNGGCAPATQAARCHIAKGTSNAGQPAVCNFTGGGRPLYMPCVPVHGTKSPSTFCLSCSLVWHICCVDVLRLDYCTVG